MAGKRSAARQLTADNWDDPEEAPDAEGPYSSAPEHVLRDRIIRRARRRNLDNNQEKKGIFTGFTGFAKTQAPTSTTSSPFSFISNLVNGGDALKTKNLITETSVLKKNEESEIKSTSLFSEDKKDEKKDTDDKAPFKIQEKSDNFLLPTKTNEPKEKDEYYSNLKNLNLSVSEWIKSHVDKNPYCILTPIFDDYINHLKELEKYKSTGPFDKTDDLKASIFKSTLFSSNKSDDVEKKKETSSLLTSKPSSVSSSFSTFQTLSKQDEKPKSAETKSPIGSLFSSNFQFGQGFASTPVSKAPMFSFGQKGSTDTTDFTMKTSTATTMSTTGFTFGSGKQFSFGNIASSPKEDSSSQKPTDEEENESDEPPKVSFTPVVEEDSVYSKRCKVFVKKNDAYGDKGVGTLYLKPIKDSEKFQLIVRADTSLGNLLLNIVLSESIPLSRMGKNNVMLMYANAEDKTPTPIPTLLRVKTADEADELLRTLEKYKK